MVSLADLPSDEFTKLFYVGDSSAGKTGSLASLVAAGYRLRILDMDNGVSILKAYVKRENPHLLSNVDVETFRDKYTLTQIGTISVGNPKAFTNALKVMTKWTDDTVPAEWGKDTIFIIDSLTTLGRAALAYAQGLNPSAKDPRQWFFAAQQAIESVIALLFGADFKTNVIIITHISERELSDGMRKGFPSSGAGTALGPTLAKYCNTMILAETTGMGESAKRKIKTLPTGFIDLKTAAPFAIQKEYPLETGLRDIFETLKQNA